MVPVMRSKPIIRSEVSPLPSQFVPTPAPIAWLTGLSGAGKTTIAQAVQLELQSRKLKVQLLDADEVRRHLNRDLGFTREDRNENVRRIGYIANLLAGHGIIVLVAAIAPYREARDFVRCGAAGSFMEIFVSAPLAVCEQRDPKGLYKRARQGKLKAFTGIDDPYEEPFAPEVRCNTHIETPAESASKVITALLDALGRELLF